MGQCGISLPRLLCLLGRDLLCQHGAGRPHAFCPLQPCVPFLAEARRSYFNTSEGQVPPKTAGKPSAHLTLRPQSLAQDGESGSPAGF